MNCLAGEQRWPRWAAKVAELGTSSVLAAELTTVERDRIGSVNVYWNPGARGQCRRRRLVNIFARHAALALSSAINEAGLNVALDTRKLIGQAQGMLMERYGLDEPRAFEVLRRYSQTHHLKLRRVAVYLVSTRELPTRLPIPDAYGHAGDRNGKVSDTGEMPPPRQP